MTDLVSSLIRNIWGSDKEDIVKPKKKKKKKNKKKKEVIKLEEE